MSEISLNNPSNITTESEARQIVRREIATTNKYPLLFLMLLILSAMTSVFVSIFSKTYSNYFFWISLSLCISSAIFTIVLLQKVRKLQTDLTKLAATALLKNSK